MGVGFKNSLLLLLVSSFFTPPVWGKPRAAEEHGSERFRHGRGKKAANRHSIKPGRLRMREAIYGGPGCPAGTMSSTLSPDGKTLSIIMDDFVVELGGDLRQKKARKTCNIQVPMDFEGAHQFSVVKMDYRGYQFLPAGGKSRLVTQYFFSEEGGRRKGRKQKRHMEFRGPMDEEYILSSETSTKNYWSKCGENLSFQIITSLTSKTNKEFDEVLSTIDSLDLNASETKYHLMWRTCSKKKRPHRLQRNKRKSRERRRHKDRSD